LAVVLDDAAAGVTDVVRGDDLLESTARQMLLAELLGLDCSPTYWHLPLVTGPDGRRLAKRHGDTRVSHYRDLGVDVRRVLGLLGYWSGILPARRPAEMDELVAGFRIERVPRNTIVFAAEDEAYLLAR